MRILLPDLIAFQCGYGDRSSDVFEGYTTTFVERSARICDATQKVRMVLEPVLEPVVLRCETD
jgi:hypothetical protein